MLGPVGMREHLALFFAKLFQLDVTALKKRDEFPTFEEALGILDLAELRRESLRGLRGEDGFADIALTRQHLIFAMALVIAHDLRGSLGRHEPQKSHLHQELVNALRKYELLRTTTFVSTNYDILIDNALINPPHEEISGSLIDYGVDFTNFDVDPSDPNMWKRWKRPGPDATALLKIHGSLNWLCCRTCNTLTLTPGMKGAIELVKDPSANVAQCDACRSLMSPLIVPPTFYKDMSRVFLSMVWNKAELALRKAEHILFCGYSFPDADIHIKYLLKRAQVNRTGAMPRITVINEHSNKTDEKRRAERLSYKRFLGPGVKYKNLSFEDFVADPKPLMTGRQ